MKDINLQWCRIEELTSIQMHSIISARESVFTVEQDCAYLDADHLDVVSWHLTAWDGKAVAGYIRVVDPGKKYGEPSIGRVITTKPYRGQGLGQLLIREGIKRSSVVFPNQGIRISAQCYLQRFYESFGFKIVSEEYLEDNIPHYEMLLEPTIR